MPTCHKTSPATPPHQCRLLIEGPRTRAAPKYWKYSILGAPSFWLLEYPPGSETPGFAGTVSWIWFKALQLSIGAHFTKDTAHARTHTHHNVVIVAITVLVVYVYVMGYFTPHTEQKDSHNFSIHPHIMNLLNRAPPPYCSEIHACWCPYFCSITFHASSYSIWTILIEHHCFSKEGQITVSLAKKTCF